ncbi:MAG: SDR family oxidoreductase [Blastocatellia bacterium]|nr:SDR family oxidoreductase [Blastocatellia bacterium]
MTPKLKIVIIGGSGLIGTKLGKILREEGHEVIPASRASGINVLTGEGLAEAMTGTQVVIDVSNSPSFEDQAVMEFFETSTRNLLAAAAAAGSGHHVAVSVVGTDRLQASGYFRAKLVQENMIKAAGIPYTIIRATQFFEFVGSIAQGATDGQTVRLSSALMQPILADDVAAAVADISVGAPLNGTLDLAGPEPIRMDELVRRYLRAHHDAREVITADETGYFGTPVDDHSLTPGANPRLGPSRFDDWLNRSTQPGLAISPSDSEKESTT